MMNKAEARKLALKNRKLQNSQMVSTFVVTQILQSEILLNYKNIGIYYPIANEIDITSLRVLYPDKKFYLPTTKNDLAFVEYCTDDLIDGPYNTKEPIGNAIDKNQMQCIIVPCVAINKNLQRIGYGKGYYDRYLKDFKGLKIGVCYSDFSNVDVECDDYDIHLDIVIKG